MKKILIDVTSTCNSPFVSGIQRVVVEWLRRLNAKYKDNLILFTNEDRSTTELRTVPNDILFQTNINKHYYSIKNRPTIKISNLNSDYVLIDVDSVWAFDKNRMILYKELNRRQVTICSFIHDLIPFANPQFLIDLVLYPNFVNFIHAIACFSKVVLYSSNETRKKCDDFFKNSGFLKQSYVIPFGNDLSHKIFRSKPTDKEIKLEKELTSKPYILCVGTIEPRKNQSLILDSYMKIDYSKINLVIVGRVGWNCNDFIKKVKNNPLFGKNIFMINDASDYLVNSLYKKSWAFVMASFDEGFGLPIIEAVLYDNLILCSDIPVFKEITQNQVIYFDNNNPSDLAHKIDSLIKDKNQYKKYKSSVKNIKLISWDESAVLLDEILRSKIF